MKPEYFDNDSIRYIYKKMAQYFNQYSNLPNLDNLQSIIALENDEQTKENAMNELEAIKNIKLEFNEDKSVWDNAREYCKKQSMYAAINKSILIHYPNKDYASILREIEQAIIDNGGNDFGLKGFEEIADSLKNIRRNIVPTGFPHLDVILNGGVGGHELAILFGPYGSGKSHWLVQLLCNAVRMGLNVIFDSLELRSQSVNARILSNFSGIDMDTLLKNEDIHKKVEQMVMEEKLKHNWGEYYVQDFPSAGTTLTDLKLHRQGLKLAQFEPDLILIDYLDLLSPSKVDGKAYTDMGRITLEMRAWSQTDDIPIWTVSQSNKESAENIIVVGSQMADSINKNRGADLLVTLSKHGYMFIDKSRLGREKMAFKVTQDQSISTFTIGEADEEEADKYLCGEKSNKASNPDSQKIRKDVYQDLLSRV